MIIVKSGGVCHRVFFFYERPWTWISKSISAPLGGSSQAEVTDVAENFKVADGFGFEKIYDLEKGEGSWA